MYRVVALEAVKVLSKAKEAERILLFGSVYKGTAHPGSDIDIAFICSDFFAAFPKDDEGLPMGLTERLKKQMEPIELKYDRRIHLCIYSENDFKRGISLGRDMLNEKSQLMYDAQENLALG